MVDSLTILERLVAFPTVSRTQNLSLISYLRDLLEARRINCRLIASEDGQNANLFASVGPTDRAGVLLSGHSDVVPVVGQAWSVEPFVLTEKDGRLYGRGTADMKGFVACAVHALLKAATQPLDTPLYLAVSYDEEIGCVGVRRMLAALQDAPIRPRFCIVGEPTELKVATGHKGKTAVRAICHGTEVHSALAPLGVNAIHLAADLVKALQARQSALKSKSGGDEDYDIPYSTIHAGIIAGGVALNIVPNRCQVDFEIRHLEGDDPIEILGHIKTEVAANLSASHAPSPGADIEFEVVNSYPGLETPADAEVVSFVKSLLGANSTIKVAFGTEGGLISEQLGVPTVVCGPGSMRQGHKPDEFITRDQMARCDAMLDQLIARMQG